MPDPLPAHYFQIHFYSDKEISHWPIHFAIIKSPSSNAVLSQQKAMQTHDEVEDELKKKFSWVKRLTSSERNQTETQTCWAVNAGWQQACELGIEFGQEIIYYVSDNTLSVTYCDQRRKPYVVDGFLRRFKVKGE